MNMKTFFIVLLNILENISLSLLEISLIWRNKLTCNFKYIYINETGFIKNIVLGVGA